MREFWLLIIESFHELVFLKLLIMLLNGFAITLANCDEMNLSITPQCLMQQCVSLLQNIVIYYTYRSSVVGRLFSKRQRFARWSLFIGNLRKEVTVYCISRNVVRVRSPTKFVGDVTLTTCNGTSSHCKRLGPKQHPRESGTIGPIAIPFGKFDYLVDLTKVPKFHRASPIGRSHMRGRNTPSRFLSFLVLFFLCSFFLELVYQSEGICKSNFFAPKGRDSAINAPAFFRFSRHEFSICKQQSQITRKRCEIRKTVLKTTYRKSRSTFQKADFLLLP